MKKILFTSVLLVIIALNGKAQIPNDGFENWDSIGVAENPTDWSSFNNFYIYNVPTLSFKTTDKHSGTYALRVISDTANVPPPFGTSILDTLTGFVFLGAPDMNNPGIQYTNRPTEIKAWVKGTIMPGGNAMIIAKLRKWNATTHMREQIGMAVYTMTSTSYSYTQVSAPFNYTLSFIPDTLEISIMAGNGGPGAFIVSGNNFFVDDISFTLPLGINEKSKEKPSISIFPNPASDKITISSLDKIKEIKIYNILGELVYESIPSISNTPININLSAKPKGIYFVKIYGEEKNYTEKIVIQ